MRGRVTIPFGNRRADQTHHRCRQSGVQGQARSLPNFARSQRALRPIRSQVDDVEWLSARIGTSTIEARGFGSVDAGLADIAERITTLQQSRALFADDSTESVAGITPSSDPTPVQVDRVPSAASAALSINSRRASQNFSSPPYRG